MPACLSSADELQLQDLIPLVFGQLMPWKGDTTKSMLARNSVTGRAFEGQGGCFANLVEGGSGGCGKANKPVIPNIPTQRSLDEDLRMPPDCTPTGA